MQQPMIPTIDSSRDLVLERIVDIAPAKVWAAWTQPKHIKHWFTPVPWSTIECELDLRPGGIFRTVMRSPEGQEFPNIGCVLEVVEGARFTWTSVLGPGYRPALSGVDGADGLHMTAIINIEAHPKGTKYTAIAIHADSATQAKHEQMGFYDGWGTVFDQLVAYMKQQ
jgi:uncharacterized protein YndB with AHSA1/START domain